MATATQEIRARRTPAVRRCLQKDTLHVDQHALDAGNDVAADVSKQSLDAAIADFREASFSSKSYSKHANHSAKACDSWKYRLILVDLVPTSDVPADRVWVQLGLSSKANLCRYHIGYRMFNSRAR